MYLYYYNKALKIQKEDIRLLEASIYPKMIVERQIIKGALLKIRC